MNLSLISLKPLMAALWDGVLPPMGDFGSANEAITVLLIVTTVAVAASVLIMLILGFKQPPRHRRWWRR